MNNYDQLNKLESLAFAKNMLKNFGFHENKIVEDYSQCDNPNNEWAIVINGMFIIYRRADRKFEVLVSTNEDTYEIGEYNDIKQATTRVILLDQEQTILLIKDNTATSFHAWETVIEDQFLASIGLNKYESLNKE